MAFTDILDRVINGFSAFREAVSTPAKTEFREAVGVTVDNDEDQWRRLTGDVDRDLSPMTQKRMRDMALYLWESNLLANRLIELPVAYLLAEGVQLTVKDEDNQKVLDRFWKDPINEMDLKLPQKVRELALYGEQCYPTFINEMNGHIRLGYLDPALIETVVTDPDNRSQVIGIVTVKDKKGVARRYRTIINGPEEVFGARTQEIRQTFSDGEAFYFTINDLSNGRRGRSDLLAQTDWLDGYEQFLFGELDRASFMRAFLWDVTLTGATPDEVKQRSKEVHPPPPGSVRVHNDAEVWQAVTPDLKAQDSSENARLFRNHVLGGATVPEHWYGGGGDVNRATGESMGEPTFKVLSMRQRMIKYILESIGRYVLRQKAIAREEGEPDFSEEAWNVEAAFPEMTARDTTKYAAALQQVVMAASLAVDRQFITVATAVSLINAIAGRLGVEIDAEAELETAKKEAAKTAEDDVFTEPPDDSADSP
ncbi:hypothetical protein [Methylocaldum sp.]|uniref:hypothetical protein n=1 Tax=Methylocaldum sp. TaxID=1969727 RepID=UPI002D57053A|nr:hypothetical protein [Methylocaldum sp.]HYE35466.1 hypothetical protein [Methylocaldum sp.]